MKTPKIFLSWVFWLSISFTFLAVIVCMCFLLAALAFHSSQTTKRLAEQTAQTLDDFNKSAFAKNGTKLISISVNGGASFPPGDQALYVHQCDMVSLLRYAIILPGEDGNYMVGKYYSWADDNGGLNVTPGMEYFTVKKNPNQMRPAFKVPSNLPHHRYLSYVTNLQDMRRPAPTQSLQTIIFYILDHAEAIPAPGQNFRPAIGSPDHDNPAECPALTVPLSLSQAP